MVWSTPALACNDFYFIPSTLELKEGRKKARREFRNAPHKVNAQNSATIGLSSLAARHELQSQPAFTELKEPTRGLRLSRHSGSRRLNWLAPPIDGRRWAAKVDQTPTVRVMHYLCAWVKIVRNWNQVKKKKKRKKICTNPCFKILTNG